MKTEKIMQEIKAFIMESTPNITEDMFNRCMEEKGNYTLFNLYIDLKEDLRKEISKSKSPKKSKIIDIVTKGCNREDIKGYHEFNNKFYFLDGYRLFKADDTFGLEKAKTQFNIGNLIKINYYEEIKADIQDVKLFIKENRLTRKGTATSETPYIIITPKGEKIGFNPFYLLDGLEYSNTDTLYYDTPLKPFYTVDSNNELECLVLPVRLKK